MCRAGILAGFFLMVVQVCSASPADRSISFPSGVVAAMPHLPTTTADWARGAKLFSGLGNVHRTISTTSPLAQRYFDQGLALAWAFNHDEATRSFAKAAEIDPHCASCYWGVSLTVGPNYNLPFLSAERAKVAREALVKALANAQHSSPVEQDLIAALARRYPDDRPLDAGGAARVLSAYAAAMHKVAARFPDDLDVQTLYAESLMNLHAWKLWTPAGVPVPGTNEIVATLERVLSRDPDHPGANHYYVHVLEASPHPEKALESAMRLPGLAPGAGHLVHMPAHIYQRIGRYEAAADANRKAAVLDEIYEKTTVPPDYYVLMYSSHNYQFLAASAAMEGRRSEAISAADRSRALVPDSMLFVIPGYDWYIAEMYTARVRFGLWNELLGMPVPDSRLPGLMVGYLYGRAMAQAATRRIAQARQTLARLRVFAGELPKDTSAGQNSLTDILAVSISMIEARIAEAEHRDLDELRSLRNAVNIEDGLAYNEPRDWFVSCRHALGAALLAAHKPDQAEAVYRDDLRNNPDNGWALFGLQAALRAQGKVGEAARTYQTFKSAWRHADIRLSASVL